MCIICNCGDDGDEFLSAFEQARAGMKAAKAAMLKCAESAVHPATSAPYHEARARYDAMHKKIARLLREWNSIEQEREQSDGGPHAG
jgi:hypothetical protein